MANITILAKHVFHVFLEPNGCSPVHVANVWEILQKKFSTGVTFAELLSIAEVIQTVVKVPPPNRDQKRKLTCLVKWYAKNFNVIRPILDYITLLDSDCQEINGVTEYQQLKRKKPVPHYPIFNK